jgi:lipopolysaccharide/colanic/teichoic acid biosynthesis glycosyltransferase
MIQVPELTGASSGFHVCDLGCDANRLAGSFLAAATLVFRSPFEVALTVAILLTGGRPVSCGQHDTRHGARGFIWIRLRSISGGTDARLGAQLAYDLPTWVKGAKSRKRHNDASIARIGGDLRASSLDGPQSGFR